MATPVQRNYFATECSVYLSIEGQASDRKYTITTPPNLENAQMSFEKKGTTQSVKELIVHRGIFSSLTPSQIGKKLVGSELSISVKFSKNPFKRNKATISFEQGTAKHVALTTRLLFKGKYTGQKEQTFEVLLDPKDLAHVKGRVKDQEAAVELKTSPLKTCRTIFLPLRTT